MDVLLRPLIAAATPAATAAAAAWAVGSRWVMSACSPAHWAATSLRKNKLYAIERMAVPHPLASSFPDTCQAMPSAKLRHPSIQALPGARLFSGLLLQRT